MANSSSPEISASDLKSHLDKGFAIHLLDVRERIEFHTFNIGGTNIPLAKLSQAPDGLQFEKHARIVVVCQHGIRSETARRLLVSAGFKNVQNLKGGILAYTRIINTI